MDFLLLLPYIFTMLSCKGIQTPQEMKMLLAPFFFIFVQVLTSVSDPCKADALPKFSAILAFGDSTVDTGNNDYVHTIIQANHLPYGRDFPGQVPTGRFSNGRLVPDLVADLLGIKQNIPPFLDPNITNDELRSGACFASAGSGFDDLTGATVGVIPFPKQIEYFKSYIERLKGFAGEVEGQKIINDSLVSISAGTNDFAMNYYVMPPRRHQYTIDEYQDFLQNKIKDFVKQLYDLGCRTIIIAGLPPVGCLPIQITSKLPHPKERTCVQDQNSDAQTYNQKLAKLIPDLQGSYPGSQIVYADTYEPLTDMINNPKKYGFTETNRGCCGTGFVEAGSTCNQQTPMCENASQFVFWDCVHPSQAAYQYLAKNLEDNILPIISKNHSADLSNRKIKGIPQ